MLKFEAPFNGVPLATSDSLRAGEFASGSAETPLFLKPAFASAAESRVPFGWDPRVS
jgi:hypothetical protein